MFFLIEQKIPIYAKAKFDAAQIEAKVEKKCDGIELHLLKEMYPNNINDLSKKDLFKTMKNAYDTTCLYLYPIRAVHIPMVYENIETLVTGNLSFILKETFKIAQKSAEIWGGPVILVVHCEGNYCLIKNMDNFLDKIKEKLYELLDEFPLVEVGIENVSPLMVKNNSVILRGGIYDDNIQLCQYINHSRVGTTLDICHAQLTEKYMSVINREYGGEIPVNYSMENFIKINAPYIKLIHLATYKGNGYGKGKHGIGFEDCNYPDIQNFVRLYKKYGYNCPITLEVEEEDYYNCKRFEKTKELLEKALKEID